MQSLLQLHVPLTSSTPPPSPLTHTHTHTQLNELQVARTKISGLEEELKQAKSLSTSSAYQQLQKVSHTVQRVQGGRSVTCSV